MNKPASTDSQSVYSINSGKNLVGVKSKRTFFKKHRKKNLLIYLLVFVAAGLLLAVFVLFYLLTVSYARFSEPLDLCDNEDCMRIAASLKESMNTSVDPCDDFYKYVCGRWPEAHPSLDLSQEYSWFTEKSIKVSRRIRDLLVKNNSDPDVPWAVNEAQRLFASCLDIDARNELGLSPLLDLLQELTLPQVPALITNDTTDFIKQLAMVKRVLWTDIFFGIYVAADPRNNERNILVFDLPEQENPFPSDKILEKRLKHLRQKTRYFEDDKTEEQAENQFSAIEKIYMSEVIKQMVSNGTTDSRTCKSRGPFSILAETEIDNAVDRIFMLSAKLWNLNQEYANLTSEDDIEIKDKDYMYIDDLQRITDEHIKATNETLIPKLIWRTFVEEMLKGVMDFDPKEKILVADIEYLKDVAFIIASSDEAELESTIWWMVMDYAAPYSSQELRKIWISYINDLTGGGSGTQLSLYCADIVNDLMGMAVAWMFFEPSFIQDETTDKVREMLDNIKISFSEFVKKADWMDAPTRQATLEKNRKMKSLIGFPDWLFDDGELDSYYEGIDLSETKFFENMLQIIRLRNLNGLKELSNNETDDEITWPLEPTEVNALHTFQENEIAIPAGILQFPFYDLGLEALNYGAIGTILGHELTHGFDNSGRRFDSAGNLKQWWSNETISRYTSKTSCFVDQYSSYYVPEVNDYIDGELTLGENIADNGGLREAYNAYQIWKVRHGKEPHLPGFSDYTHEQLLFLGYAHMWCESYTTSALRWMLVDPHCPGHVRLKMVLRNSEHFSEAWNCPVGSNMNPAKKCQLW